MIKIFISGEGYSDLGGIAYDGRLFPGPLLFLINDIVSSHQKFQYNILECASETYTYIPKQVLESKLKAMKNGRRGIISLARNEKGYHSYHAYALASLAEEMKMATSEKTICFFFRDSDGVHSTPSDDYQKKLESINKGFSTAGYSNGVAILAKPKSEAWILSILDGCCNGLKYESCSGNDDSPNSLKKQLENKLGDKFSTPNFNEFLCDLLKNNDVSHEKLSDTLTSYKIFYNRTLEVLASL